MLRNVWLVAVAVLAAACGGGKGSTTASPRASASASASASAGGATNCSDLLQQAEVAAAFGNDVDPPQQHSAAGGGLRGVECQWYSNGTLAADVGVFTGSAEAARAQLEQHKQGAAGEDVSGVGEAAFFSQFTGQLEAVQGDTLVRVAVGAPEGETDFSGLLPKDKQLMELVLGRV